MSSTDPDGGTLFARFINADGALRLPGGRAIPLVNPRRPLEVGGLLVAIIAAVFTEVMVGVLRFINSYFTAYIRVIDGLAEFTVAFAAALGFAAEMDALFQQLNAGFQAFGVFRPIAVVVVSLLTVWAAARLASVLFEEVFG